MVRNEFNLQAVILCDTYLPRFHPLTESIPRCLLPLANVPLIEYTLEFLVNTGATEVFLMCCAHSQQVTQYIKQSKWSSNLVPFKVHTLELPNTMSVGDAMRDLDSRGIITSDFLLISGDVVCNIDFEPIWEAHLERKKHDKNCIMSMVLREASAIHRTRSNKTGLFAVDNSTDRLVAFYKSVLKKEVEIDASELLKLTEVAFRNDLIDCRIDICTMDVPALFTENFDYQYLRDDLVRGILTSDLLGKTIYTHIIKDGYAARVESLKTYKSVTKDIVSRYAYPLVVDSNAVQGQTYTYQRGHIYKEQDVVLSQSCTIGMETVIGGKTVVGENSEVRRSTLGRDCHLGNGVKVERSCVLDNVQIKDNTTVNDAVIGSNTVIGSNVTIDAGAVIGCGYVVPDNTHISAGSKLSMNDNKRKIKNEDDEGDSDATVDDSGSESDYAAVAESEDEENTTVPDMEDLAGLIDEMYLSDDSIESFDLQQQQEARSNRRQRRRSRTLSFKDAESDGDDTREEFIKEAIAIVNRTIVENHPQDLTIMQLNTLRMTMNTPHELVVEAVVIALITHISHLITQADVKKVTSNVFNSWAPTLKRITFDEAGQIQLGGYIEQCCAGRPQGDRVLAYALMELYDNDTISEEAVYGWWKLPPATPNVRHAAGQWVEWLENAEEESESE